MSKLYIFNKNRIPMNFERVKQKFFVLNKNKLEKFSFQFFNGLEPFYYLIIVFETLVYKIE